MEKELILHGIRLGQYEYAPDTITSLIRTECIEKGMNFVSFDRRFGELEFEKTLEWVKYMVENKVYFVFTYDHGRGNNRGNLKNPCILNEKTCEIIKEIAGEYYIGNTLDGEVCTEYACVGSEYWPNHNDGKDMLEANNNLRKTCNVMIKEGNFNGKVPLTSIEQTNVMTWMAEEGLSYPTLETLVGNPEIMVPLTRSVAKHIKSKKFATYIAHEWYGGVRMLDVLKSKRLKLVYDFSYMHGSSEFILESGDNVVYAHDTMAENGAENVKSPFDTIYDYNHPTCKGYRDVLENFAKFLKKDTRPKGGPKVKVAFIQGNLDGYSDWRCGSSLYHCFGNPEFGYSDPEFMWKILNDISVKRNWADVHNFGEIDLSGAPAYGTYDIVPATADIELLSKYDYLIFVGWNTMTDKIYANLKKYVKNGGRLFMTAAHLNTSVRRNGEISLINNGDVSDLFGCKLSADKITAIEDGFKFDGDSIVPELMYPKTMFNDPLLPEGYINYPEVTIGTAVAKGKLSRRFVEKDPDALPVWLTENKLGKGYAILMTTTDYPSRQGYSIYKAVVREILTASHRNADIKVYGGDKLRFTVYEGDKVYLLNTDFDCQTQAVIDYGNGEIRKFTLEPLELKPVER